MWARCKGMPNTVRESVDNVCIRYLIRIGPHTFLIVTLSARIFSYEMRNIYMSWLYSVFMVCAAHNTHTHTLKSRHSSDAPSNFRIKCIICRFGALQLMVPMHTWNVDPPIIFEVTHSKIGLPNTHFRINDKNISWFNQKFCAVCLQLTESLEHSIVVCSGR